MIALTEKLTSHSPPRCSGNSDVWAPVTLHHASTSWAFLPNVAQQPVLLIKNPPAERHLQLNSQVSDSRTSASAETSALIWYRRPTRQPRSWPYAHLTVNNIPLPKHRCQSIADVFIHEPHPCYRPIPADGVAHRRRDTCRPQHTASVELHLPGCNQQPIKSPAVVFR